MKPEAPQTLGFQLTLAARLYRTRLARTLQTIGLFPGQEQVLTALGESATGLTMGQLARRMRVRPPTLTKTIQRLQSQDLIARSANEADGRIVLLALTDAGRERLLLVLKAEEALEAELAGLFKPKAGARLRKGLKRLSRHLAPPTDPLAQASAEDEAAEDPED